MLEEALKWGAAHLFRGGTAGGADADMMEAADAAGGGRRRQERGTYSEEQVRAILDVGHAACCADPAAAAADPAAAALAAAADAAAADGGAAGAASPGGGAAGPGPGVSLGPGLELVTLRSWGDVDKRVEDDVPSPSDEAEDDLLADEKADDVDGAGDDDAHADGYGDGASAFAGAAGGGAGTPGGSMANAAFWGGLLRERYESQRKEEEAAHELDAAQGACGPLGWVGLGLEARRRGLALHGGAKRADF